MEKVDILGVKFNNVNMERAIKEIEYMLMENKFHMVVTPNPEFVMLADKDKEYMNILNGADLVLPDGIGIVIGSKIMGEKISERVTGFDVCKNIFELSNRKGYTIYFLGAKEGVAQRAKEKLESKYENIKIVGVHNGYFKGDSIEEENLLNEINSLKPDILLVALGTPRQEKWLDRNRKRLNVKVAIGVGGTFDVVSGDLKRAPKFIQKAKLEWLYRLLQEPKRIGRVSIIPKYLIKILKKKFI